MDPTDDLLGRLSQAGIARGDRLGLSIGVDCLGLAVPGETPPLVIPVPPGGAGALLTRVEEELRPCWTWWSAVVAADLRRGGLRVATCWDIGAVHRLLAGGWNAGPGRAWATAVGLDPADRPVRHPVDLFHPSEPVPENPVRTDGHLDAEWVAGEWAHVPARVGRWAAIGLEAAAGQEKLISSLVGAPHLAATARSESGAELLAGELATDGLPVDRTRAEAVIAGFIGPRPRTALEADLGRVARDDRVRLLVPGGERFDLRSPGQVKALLRSVGIELADTRAWRLEEIRGEHPVVEALLAWRRAERIETTFGYRWLDEHVDPDGRLRGEWTACDGAAGRMTASNGLHNLPAELRAGVVAQAGHVFVRADLAQVEPRVLAAVSGDQALARATRSDDLYATVAAQLGVDRATAKVAVLGAMYGQTTGHGAQALAGLRRAYPVAVGFLDAAARQAEAGQDLRTHGGRLIPMGGPSAGILGEREARARDAARGRYGRNAVIQGSAAELFKVWALVVRARVAALGGQIVLCLHDELLVQVPADRGEEAVALVEAALEEAAARWHPGTEVGFRADTSVIGCWADAKT